MASAAVGWIAKAIVASVPFLGQDLAVDEPDEGRAPSAYVIADRAMTRC